MIRGFIFGFLCLFAAQVSHASSFDLNLNGDAVRITFTSKFRNPKLGYDVGWLHGQDEGDVANFSVHRVDLASGSENPVHAGIGGRLVYMDADNGGSGGALGLGGFFRYTLTKWDRVVMKGHLYFAPDLLSFGDAKQYLDTEFRVGYSVLRDANVYVGLRLVQGEFDRFRDVDFDDGLHIGLELTF